MDKLFEDIVRFYGSAPVPALPRVTGLQIRERWAATALLLNAGAPDRPVERGRIIATRRDATPLTVDVYPPDGVGPHPSLLFIHGGAWVAGSPMTHDKLTKRLAEAGFLVVSVDYALAPEARHPAGFEDCVVAADWFARNAGDLGADPKRLGIAGDSAGANLAAATLHQLLERDGRTAFSAAFLPYGVYDFPAMLELPDDSPFVNARTFAWQVEDYLGPDTDAAALREPTISPRYSPHLGSFPPTFMVVGTRDPLLAQSVDFAAALPGGAGHLEIYEEATHAFLQIEPVAESGQAFAAGVSFLRETLALPSSD